MNITMEGEYAYAKDPYTKVRILCVDRPNKYAPIISMNEEGYLYSHRVDGTKYPLSSADYNLTPLNKKPIERWAVEINEEFISTYPSEKLARERASGCKGVRIFLMREVEE